MRSLNTRKRSRTGANTLPNPSPFIAFRLVATPMAVAGGMLACVRYQCSGRRWWSHGSNGQESPISWAGVCRRAAAWSRPGCAPDLFFEDPPRWMINIVLAYQLGMACSRTQNHVLVHNIWPLTQDNTRQVSRRPQAATEWSAGYRSSVARFRLSCPASRCLVIAKQTDRMHAGPPPTPER